MRALARLLWSAVFLLALVVKLPHDARVTAEGPENGWRQEGDMACAVMAACRQWESCLARQGWTVADKFSMRGGRYVSVWRRDGVTLTLLVWEKAIGRSGFSWGAVSSGSKR